MRRADDEIKERERANRLTHDLVWIDKYLQVCTRCGLKGAQLSFKACKKLDADY